MNTRTRKSRNIDSVYKLVRRYALRLPRGSLFTTRDVLIYGSRNSIDQALYRLVKNGTLVRFARGVFALEDTPPPSPFIIAKTKANAFFKNLTKGCRDFVNQLGSLEPISRKYKYMFDAHKFPCNIDASMKSQVVTFSVNGCSSSFRYGNITIKLHGVSGKKIQLGETRVGAIVRALWHLGKNNIDPELSPQNVWDFNHPETIEFDEYKKLMPSWLSNICFKNTPWIWRRMLKFEPLPLEQYDSEWDEEEYNEWVKSLNA